MFEIEKTVSEKIMKLISNMSLIEFRHDAGAYRERLFSEGALSFMKEGRSLAKYGGCRDKCPCHGTSRRVFIFRINYMGDIVSMSSLTEIDLSTII